MAKFIAIEGPDKHGKETQTKKLVEAYKEKGLKVKSVEVPINDNVTYKLIYWMLRTGWAKKLPATFQFVQFINKFIFQLVVVPYLMLMYDIVVFDRWSPSSFVYGSCEGLNRWYLSILYALLFKPNATIVFHGTSFKRTTTIDDSYEKDTELQKNVRVMYKAFAECEDDLYPVSNEGTIDEVHKRVLRALESAGV